MKFLILKNSESIWINFILCFFHKLARELRVDKVETFGCKVNKRGGFYMLKSDVDMLRFINNLKSGDVVDVYIYGTSN